VYRIHEAKYQQSPQGTYCAAGSQLPEIRISATRQQYIAKDGTTKDALKSSGKPHKHSVATLRVRIDYNCGDCGSQIDPGFYIRVEHGPNGQQMGDSPTKCSDQNPKLGPMGRPSGDLAKFVVNDDPACIDQSAASCTDLLKDGWGGNRFEFASKKALTCGGTGTFDVFLTNLDQSTEGSQWPCDLRISLISACREELAYTYLVPVEEPAVIVAPSWIGSFWS